YWCYDRHRSVRLVVLVGLAIDQIAQSGLSSLSVIYYSAHLFSYIPVRGSPCTQPHLLNTRSSPFWSAPPVSG
ncbi:hypothetical protein DN592_30185, partial [Raoultella ornithinolytica]